MPNAKEDDEQKLHEKELKSEGKIEGSFAIQSLDSIFKRINLFFESGIFFIVLGIALLYCSYLAQNSAKVHSSFTFVLVVLSVAILLFGTGTKSSGTFKTPEEGATGAYAIRAYMAGGAGVIAFLAAWGIVELNEDIRIAFGGNDTLFEVSMKVVDDGKGKFELEELNVEASIAGRAQPVFRRGDRYVVLVSRNVKIENEDMKIEFRLHPKPNRNGYNSKIPGVIVLEKALFERESWTRNRHGTRVLQIEQKQLLVEASKALQINILPPNERETEEYRKLFFQGLPKNKSEDLLKINPRIFG